MGAVKFMKVRAWFRTVFIVLFLLLLAGTVVYMLKAPEKEDARIREEMGDPVAFVTDTARSPWIHAWSDGVPKIYHEDCARFTVLRLPEMVNGVAVLHIGNTFEYALSHVERLILPSTMTHPGMNVSLADWTSLKEIVFREGIRDISGVCLSDVEALEAIYLPKSLSALRSNLLGDDTGNPTIYYAGTEEEWLALGAAAEKISQEHTMVFETSAPEEWLESTKSEK